jgi:hypothetical protein
MIQKFEHFRSSSLTWFKKECALIAMQCLDLFVE